jgi:hypothetical protein
MSADAAQTERRPDVNEIRCLDCGSHIEVLNSDDHTRLALYRRAVALLERIQWSTCYCETMCPECKADEPWEGQPGHAPGCELDAILRAARELGDVT